MGNETSSGNDKPKTQTPTSRRPALSRVPRYPFRSAGVDDASNVTQKQTTEPSTENIGSFKIPFRKGVAVFEQESLPSMRSKSGISSLTESIKSCQWPKQIKVKFVNLDIEDVMTILGVMNEEGITRVIVGLTNINISKDVNHLRVKSNNSNKKEQITATNVDSIHMEKCIFAEPSDNLTSSEMISDILSPFAILFPRLKQLYIQDEKINDINFRDLWIDRLVSQSIKHSLMGSSQGILLPEIINYDIGRTVLYCNQLIPSLKTLNDIDLVKFGDLVKFNPKLYGIPNSTVLKQMHYEDLEEDIKRDIDIQNIIGDVFEDPRVKSLIQKIETKYKNNGKKLFKWDKTDDDVKNGEYIEDILNRYVAFALHPEKIALLVVRNSGKKMNKDTKMLKPDDVIKTLREVFQDEVLPRMVHRDAPADESPYLASLKLRVVKSRCQDFTSIAKPSLFKRVRKKLPTKARTTTTTTTTTTEVGPDTVTTTTATTTSAAPDNSPADTPADTPTDAVPTTTAAPDDIPPTNTTTAATTTTGADTHTHTITTNTSKPTVSIAGMIDETKQDEKENTDQYPGCLEIVLCLSTDFINSSPVMEVEKSARATDHEMTNHFKQKFTVQCTRYSFWVLGNESGHDASDLVDGFSMISEHYGVRNVKKCIEYKSISIDDIKAFLSMPTDKAAISKKEEIFQKISRENFENLEFFQLYVRKYTKQFLSGPLPKTLWMLKKGLVKKATFRNVKEKDAVFRDFFGDNSFCDANTVIPMCSVIPIEVV